MTGAIHETERIIKKDYKSLLLFCVSIIPLLLGDYTLSVWIFMEKQ